MNVRKGHQTILILDFGSQYTQLIARRIRELGVYSEIQPYNTEIPHIKNNNIRGIILSGGPSSVYSENAPLISKTILDLDIPVLGICYGLQLIIDLSGGKVSPAPEREYGEAKLSISEDSALLKDISDNSTVWMSHGDKITQLTSDYKTIARTDNSPNAVVQHISKPIFGLQFHPEVKHTIEGETLLKNFCFNICSCSGDWSTGSFIEESLADIQKQVGSKNVICGLSGGVDSSVVAVLLDKAIGKQLQCIFVNTGLLRLNEAQNVEKVFSEHFHINLLSVDKSNLFLSKLAGIENPEE
ncbi:MAG: glutamine-hydrolyzing GMP synthase, partial [Calditrichia bacterium]|nr:glutamine-hydrolyzing GMP synthase [Calditrichia bacterium]